MAEVEEIFNELGISHYLHDFIEQGFDTWETILDITESDFNALGVKLGHRRKLQRKIANSRGLSSDRAIQSPQHTPSDDQQADDQKGEGAKTDIKDGGCGTQGAKRKYRRHPKPDDNAPERPPSAYVIFSNKMREDLKGRNLTFTEIAKLVGENWQSLSPPEKEPFEQQAFIVKERYSNKLAEYKKTDQYREYSLYLVDFKARQSNQQQTSDVEAAKRPKLEAQTSATSSGTGSSVSSTRLDHSSSHTGPWLPSEIQRSPQAISMPKLPVILGPPIEQGSPTATSPTVLPGYRDSIYAGGSNQHQNLGWKDGERDENSTVLKRLPRIYGGEDWRSIHLGAPSAESRNLAGLVQHNRTTGQDHVPSLLRSESTNTSTSTISSAYFSPRTPMEPPLDRALPIPSLYAQKATPGSENQLPPLRPSSLSPQSKSFSVQQSPHGIHALAEISGTIPPLRSFIGTAPHIDNHDQSETRVRRYISVSTAEDQNLDPVSALLRAGEIVKRRSQGR